MIQRFLYLWKSVSHRSIQVILNFWNLFCGPKYDLPYKMFYVFLRRMCVLLLFCGIFCLPIRYIWSLMWFKSTASLFTLSRDELSIVENGVVKSPTIIALSFICPFSSVSICFIYLGAQHRFAIVVSYWWIDP